MRKEVLKRFATALIRMAKSTKKLMQYSQISSSDYPKITLIRQNSLVVITHDGIGWVKTEKGISVKFNPTIPTGITAFLEDFREIVILDALDNFDADNTLVFINNDIPQPK